MNRLWEQLNKITKLEFTAQCRKIPPTFEQRKGVGKVDVRDPNSETITFFEKGKWSSVQGKELTGFTNVIRWRLDKREEILHLDHLRMGVDQPVPLLSLEQVEKNLFKSLGPHQCKEDTYFGSVLFDEHFIHLHWRIIGPKKNELQSIVYF